MNQINALMWTKPMLMQEMKAAVWQPTQDEGVFIHRNTKKRVNIDEKDKDGRFVWISCALAHVTPPPF